MCACVRKSIDLFKYDYLELVSNNPPIAAQRKTTGGRVCFLTYVASFVQAGQ